MKAGALKAAVSVVGLGLYAAACWVFLAGHSDIRSVVVAQAAWLVMAIAAARMWRARFSEAAAIVGGAALMFLAWWPVILDFSPDWLEHGPAAVIFTLLLMPLPLAAAVGYSLGNRGGYGAGLAFALAYVGLLPVQIHNEDYGVAGGWQEYGLDPQAWLAFLAVGVALTAGAGWLGSRLRRTVTRAG